MLTCVCVCVCMFVVWYNVDNLCVIRFPQLDVSA